MNIIKRITATLVAAFLITGCAVLEWGAENTDTARLAVKAGTLRFIEAAPADERGERAADVAEVVGTATEQADSEAESTVADIDARVREEIDWQRLEASEQLLVDALVISIRERLEERVGDGVLTEDDRLRVRTVLEWAAEAAAIYQ